MDLEESAPPLQQRFDVVRRSALLDRLAGCIDTPLVLLKAPSGYGKTVLLTQLWQTLREQGKSVRWLSLLPAHAEGQAMRDALATSLGIPAGGCERLVHDASDIDVLIVDAVDKWPVGQPNPELERLIHSTNRRYSVVMASNRRLPFPVAELSLQRRLATFDATDLRCDANDVAALLQVAPYRGWRDAAVRDVLRYTEGWITGIAMLLQSDPDAPGKRFSKVLPRNIFAYFNDYAFSAFPLELRRLLLAASVVDQLTPSLFERLTDVNGLFELEEENVFLAPTPAAPLWRRFHRLYLGFLRERASGLGRAVLQKLHRRAAEWHLELGSLTEAAQHAIESADPEFLTATVSRAARAFIANGQIADTLAWLEQLGAEVMRGNPLIRLYHVTALTLSGRAAEADAENRRIGKSVEEVADGPGGPDWARVVGEQVAFHRELIAFWRRESDPQGRVVTALRELPSENAFWLGGEAGWLLGLALAARGDLDGANASFTAAAPALARSHSWYALASLHATAARLEHWSGDSGRAVQRCRAAISDITESADGEIPALAMLRLSLWSIEADLGRPDPNAAEVGALEDALQQLLAPEWDARYRLLAARLELRERGVASARQALEQAAAAAALAADPALRARVASEHASLCLISGDIAAARRVLGAEPAATRGTTSRPSEAERARFLLSCAWARVLVADQLARDAVRRFSDLASYADRARLIPDRIEAQLGLAGALYAAGEGPRAARTLRDALLLGQRSSLVRPFRDATDLSVRGAIASMARDSAATGSGTPSFESDYLAAIAGHPSRRPSAATQEEATAAPAELTSKETEVIELVASGLSNQQIAGELFISLGTVKWHVRNILSKLDAPNRTTAIRKYRTRSGSG